MARKRKVEAKASPKEVPKSSSLRKSTRQRAKKQLEEKKVNGDVLLPNSSNAEDSEQQCDNQDPVGQINTVPKKPGRPKNSVNKEKSVLKRKEKNQEQSVTIDNSKNEEPDAIQEQPIDLNKDTAIMWPEESIVEETIICEEMEVESSCPNENDESIVLEQVLLVEDSNSRDANIVEYTVVENESEIESMIISSEDVKTSMTLEAERCENTSGYQIIEQGLSVLQMSESDVQKSIEESENQLTLQMAEVAEIVGVPSITNNIRDSNSETSKKEGRLLRNTTRSSSRSTRGKVNSDKNIKNESDRKKTIDSSKKKNVTEKEKSLDFESQEHKAKVETVERAELQNLEMNTQKSKAIITKSDSDPSVPTKSEQQGTSVVVKTDLLNDGKVVSNTTVLECKSTTSVSEKNAESVIQFSKESKQVIFGNEEHSQESEADRKMEFEDIKVCSSSENSNDTLSSSNSCNNMENSKSTVNPMNESEKKPGFRSRSGSTDTTGSESGSNSSAIRRSNRIKTIGLMKQRSRGRGLVSKPPADPTKAVPQQEANKPISIAVPTIDRSVHQVKVPSDNVPESLLDKENKTESQNNPNLPVPVGTTSFDSDSNKPVKVKSRWRRSSELEMGSSGSWFGSRSDFPSSSCPTIIENVHNTSNDSIAKLTPVPVESPLELQGSMISSENVASDKEIPVDPNNLSLNSTSTLIPKSVGAKISLPMVPEIDREMEERLSQFEHLRENLYLTERYTNKETKRMVCDCFLTEEDIHRGELGCGEDCLNRLLMIECGSRCVVSDRCTNKRFQNCEYAKCEVFRTEKKGFGLRAVADLYPGDFIMEYVGEVVDPRDFRKRAKEYSKDKNRHYYFMALKSDQIIDATMKGNISRFINHSCDPNAETQKWTVNGELRIGFFNKKFVAAGDEITFDYHFQRYGKEAQRCFCEAVNCRGWIGDNPEDSKENAELVDDTEDIEDESEDEVEDEENEKENKTEKPEKKVRRRKREEKKVTEHMEDEDLEEQIDKLCASGLKNRAHTLTLSRLMVRCRETQHRTRLLKVIQSGEQPCRRLFLDYHGLRLMWSYMMDVAGDDSPDVQLFRLEILKTLSTLPIPNRTMLIDSKILNVIEKWSKQLPDSISPSVDSPEDDQVKVKSAGEEPPEQRKSGKPDPETIEQALISELASNLLVDWSNLKEVFRIPKKERIEQMKEHEREADRGYKEDAEKEARDNSSYDRARSRSQQVTPVPTAGTERKEKVQIERSNLVQVPRMSKFERRQLFALKVAKEEEERQRRQQEDSWQQHEAQCIALGLDPFATAAFDPQTGYPLFFNPQLGQWQAFPVQAPEQALALFGQVGQNGGVELAQPAAPEPEPAPGPEQPPALDLPPKWKWARDKRGRVYYYHARDRVSQWLPPPPEHIGVPADSSPSSSEESDDSSPSNSEDDEPEEEPEEELEEVEEPTAVETENPEEELEERELDDFEERLLLSESRSQQEQSMEVEPVARPTPEPRRRRDGLVQERIISPRREENRVDHKKYKEIKEKLRRQKERAKLKEQFQQEKIRKHRRSSKSKSHSKHSSSKFQVITSDMSPTQERKIKDTFRINMAHVMVHFLNPYRKNDCKQGRITNTEDFKHLARKLTHFVMAKELKHCKSVDELECNDNVKHKAKDFVRKYMSKFGAVYQKDTDED